MPPAKDRVYDYVRDRLFGGDQDEVLVLTEGDVADALDVSRTPVREAFLKLEADGYIQLVPRKGAFVRQISEREIREVMQVRQLIETWAAPRYENKEQLVEVLRSLCQEQATAVREEDVRGFIESDRRFHKEFVSAAGNRVIADLYERLRDKQVGIALRSILSEPERMAGALREHELILEALERGDLAACEAAIEAHLTATVKGFVSHGP